VSKYAYILFLVVSLYLQVDIKIENFVFRHRRDTLKVLGSVGEPINPEAWLWYYNLVGQGKCSIVDTFWQTETGGHVLTPLPGCTPMKPGSAVWRLSLTPYFTVTKICQ